MGQAVSVHDVWKPLDPPRALTAWEKKVIGLLAPNAPARAIEAVLVTDRCGCGCSSVGFSDVAHFPAGEADASDDDGVPISVMLFADREQEILATLDVLRADGQPIHDLPPVERFVVSNTSSWTGGDLL
ncbi:MAG: hypothetical protein QOH16_640 [Gaiellaceae bacterium]|nr:hypothetical protein [Gaiellaceae bacterium]